MERPGVQSGDEQGAGPGWKVGRNRGRVGVESGDEGTAWGGWWQTAFTPPLAQHSLPRVESGDDQGTPRGGKWRGDSSELTGTQTSIIREQPGAESGDDQGTPRGGKWGRPEAQRSLLGTALTRPGTVLTRPGTALAHTSDTTP